MYAKSVEVLLGHMNMLNIEDTVKSVKEGHLGDSKVALQPCGCEFTGYCGKVTLQCIWIFLDEQVLLQAISSQNTMTKQLQHANMCDKQLQRYRPLPLCIFVLEMDLCFRSTQTTTLLFKLSEDAEQGSFKTDFSFRLPLQALRRTKQEPQGPR